ncbi:MAG: tRNA (adenosine(37)-N6)-dimethylallyltransferase MiaA [Gammaproteobacteria bacterium]|nr:tRNA (adenosine(37)-N6)-dimethylallyltransferase MiaA [Gammaproteobacteria bacterium]
MNGAPIICLMGPTACGKTDLAVQLVQALPCEIVSVDSALVYKGMDIGTAKPAAEVLAVAPHRLIDFLDPAEAYSAARFVTDAQREIVEIRARGRVPLLVGGTMLYFRALFQGIARLPPASATIRAALVAQAQAQGWVALHAELMRVDPVAAQRIHPNDPQRIQRALEVFQLTGRPLSYWQQHTTQPLTEARFLLGLVPSDRHVLRLRIADRFTQMLKAGLIEEVMRLRLRTDLSLDTPAIRAVGYRQVWEYLAAQYSYSEMVNKAVHATQQLAKRQLTWLRSTPSVRYFDCLNSNLAPEVLKTLQQARIF